MQRKGTGLYLFCAVSFGPQLEQPQNNGLRQRGVLLHKLDDAVGELGVVGGDTSWLVQWDQYLSNRGVRDQYILGEWSETVQTRTGAELRPTDDAVIYVFRQELEPGT